MKPRRTSGSVPLKRPGPPYGELCAQTVSTENYFRFPGQYEDDKSGLYYNWHRYYDPSVGRYTQPDPIGLAGGLNLYSYAAQNPTCYIDPMGLADPSTPWSVGWEWLTGTGPRDRYFESGDEFTEMLRKHHHIQQLRDMISGQLVNCQSVAPGNWDYSLAGLGGVPKYVGDYSTLLTGGLTGNLAATYLGSYDLEYRVGGVDWRTGLAIVSISVDNKSTISSATHPPLIGYTKIWNDFIGKPLDEFFSAGALSGVRQHFQWEETIVFDPCKCRRLGGGK